MVDKRAFAKEMVLSVALAFFSTIVGASVVGWLFGDTVINVATEYEGLLRLGSAGLAFESIAQLLLFSLIMGTLVSIFTTDHLFKKAMLLWRCVITMILSVITLVTFVIIFRWFPLDAIQGWVVILTSFVTIFAIPLIAAIIATKRKDKRMEKQLVDYKRKQRDELDVD